MNNSNINNFFSASSHGANASSVIQECMQLLEQAPADVNFGFIYVSDVMADFMQEILNQCKSKTGIQHWVGSIGVGLIANNLEMYDQPAISLMLCQFPDGEFNMLNTIVNNDDLATKINQPTDAEACFAMIHADAYNPQSQQLIHDLGKAVNNCFITGGFTSSRTSQYQVVDNISSGGISGVLFSENIGVQTNLSQGCTPLSEKHTITRAQDNVVIELDNKPALDVLYEDIGETLSRDIEKASSYIFAGLCIPNSDRSDYTVRNLIGVDERKKVFVINDHLVEGNELIICRRDADAAVHDMQTMLENLKKRINGAPRGGVYISCLGRGREQFGDNSEEIKMIHQVLGNFPLTGFFANGEIHHNRVYGYTGVLTLFT